ncbi:lamin tail domain-containing protein [Vibrio mexicanus]|uniref:lamin tail domain-containing protein n=1 Tax=Vibrio mexicanus TaxID=1004326 RepID=UPI000AD5571C|nr:lamin tail domain-containing protein [Vibrio mexicanus]
MSDLSMNDWKEELTKQLGIISEQLREKRHFSNQDLDKAWKVLNALQAKTQVGIGCVFYRGEPDPLDEYVEICNRGLLTVDISGWRIQAGSPDQEYIFPEHSKISPFETIRLDTRGTTEHSFNSNTPIWNNRGDVATLMDESGEQIASWVYGGKGHECVLISDLFYDGLEKRSEGDEYIELSNTSNSHVDLAGWRIECIRNGSNFVFPPQSTLEPNTSCRVYTNKPLLVRNEYSFNSPTAIWNNQSGGAKLVDYHDREVSSFHY